MKCLGIRQQCDTETGYCHADGTYGSGCLVSGRHKEENTQGMINVIRHPKIHIISHLGDGSAELDFERLVLAAKDAHTLLEINNHSLAPQRHKTIARAESPSSAESLMDGAC